jgi:hypothetical protein
MVLFGIPALALDLALLVMVQWKETEFFWRNAGGYPVWLRHLVFYTFYPLFFLETGLVSLVTLMVLRHALQRRFGSRLGLAAVVVLWGVFGVVVTVLVWDNIANLFQGRSLHWHEH